MLFFLTKVETHFQVLFVTFIEYGQNVNKHSISWIKLFGEKQGVYVTCGWCRQKMDILEQWLGCEANLLLYLISEVTRHCIKHRLCWYTTESKYLVRLMLTISDLLTHFSLDYTIAWSIIHVKIYTIIVFVNASRRKKLIRTSPRLSQCITVLIKEL